MNAMTFRSDRIGIAIIHVTLATINRSNYLTIFFSLSSQWIDLFTFLWHLPGSFAHNMLLLPQQLRCTEYGFRTLTHFAGPTKIIEMFNMKSEEKWKKICDFCETITARLTRQKRSTWLNRSAFIHSDHESYTQYTAIANHRIHSWRQFLRSAALGKQVTGGEI